MTRQERHELWKRWESTVYLICWAFLLFFLFLVSGGAEAQSAPKAAAQAAAKTGDYDDFNYLMNRVWLPCDSKIRCHPLWPSRREISATARLECTGYVMAKAHMLVQQGIADERMAVAVFPFGKTAHAVLVIDKTFVLDNLSDEVRGLEEYRRFNPTLYAIPWRI